MHKAGEITYDIRQLTRVEGEGRLSLTVRDGQVTEAHLEIFEAPRYFERLVVGHTPDEVIDIVARICGICPIAYQMSAVHAFERLFDGGQVLRLRLHHDVGTGGLGGLEPGGGQVRRDHGVRADQLGEHHVEQADRSGPHHHDGVVGSDTQRVLPADAAGERLQGEGPAPDRPAPRNLRRVPGEPSTRCCPLHSCSIARRGPPTTIPGRPTLETR